LHNVNFVQISPNTRRRINCIWLWNKIVLKVHRMKSCFGTKFIGWNQDHGAMTRDFYLIELDVKDINHCG
jgi:hypothetical protein